MIWRKCSLAGVLMLVGLAGCATPARTAADRGRWDRTRLDVALQLADEHVATGRLDRAQALLADFPATDERRLQLARARIAVEQGEYAAALRALETVALEADRLPAFHQLRAVAYEGLGRWAQAAGAYQRAYTLEPSAERLVAWLDTLVLDERAAEARTVLEKERRGFPGNASLHAVAGRLYARLGEPRAAASDLRAAVLMKPDVPELREQLARACVATKAYAEASSIWRELIASSSEEEGRHRFRHCLASTLLAAGRYAEAADVYRRLVQCRSDDAAAHAGLGVAELARNRPEEALRAARSALRANPASVEARLLAALAHARLGQLAPAAEALALLPPAERARPLVREMRARWQAGATGD